MFGMAIDFAILALLAGIPRLRRSSNSGDGAQVYCLSSRVLDSCIQQDGERFVDTVGGTTHVLGPIIGPEPCGPEPIQRVLVAFRRRSRAEPPGQRRVRQMGQPKRVVGSRRAAPRLRPRVSLAGPRRFSANQREASSRPRPYAGGGIRGVRRMNKGPAEPGARSTRLQNAKDNRPPGPHGRRDALHAAAATRALPSPRAVSSGHRQESRGCLNFLGKLMDLQHLH
jgi:hypothetical protein